MEASAGGPAGAVRAAGRFAVGGGRRAVVGLLLLLGEVGLLELLLALPLLRDVALARELEVVLLAAVEAAVLAARERRRVGRRVGAARRRGVLGVPGVPVVPLLPPSVGCNGGIA